MKRILVNAILEGEAIKSGCSFDKFTVDNNLREIYSEETIRKFSCLASNNAGEISFFDRFCQFIVLIWLKATPQGLEAALQFVDCQNNVDIALDEYLRMTKNNWDSTAKRQFMRMFQLIEQDPKREQAEMVVNQSATLSLT